MEHGVQLQDLITWAFEGVLTGCAVLLVHELSGMKRSIEKLNETMASVVTTLSFHGKEIDRLDSRVDKLESK